MTNIISGKAGIVAMVLAISVFMLPGCTVTTTREKKPEFKVGNDTLQHNLNTLLTFEHANVNGIEKKTNGKTETNLEIDIINGANIPSDDVQLKALGKTIALQLKQELKNPNEYGTYEVFFVIQKTDKSVTNRSYRSIKYTSEEVGN